MEALAARGIPFSYLRDAEITNPKSRRPVITFSIKGIAYYFDGWLRSAGSSLVPGPPVHGQVAHDFVNDKGLIKAFVRGHGFCVPEGAVFARDQLEQAETFFTSLVASRPAGACVKPTKGGYGRNVHLGVRDLSSFRGAFVSIGRRFNHVIVEELLVGETCRILWAGAALRPCRGVPCM
jgi:hypothetical protein